MNPLNPRQTATILAALRYWQRHQAALVGASNSAIPEDDIATDSGTLEPMRPDEIDGLCEHINSGAIQSKTPGKSNTKAGSADFVVSWAIDVFDVPNHRAAAEHALATQRNPESIATVFNVTGPDLQEVTIDLSETDEDDSNQG